VQFFCPTVTADDADDGAVADAVNDDDTLTADDDCVPDVSVQELSDDTMQQIAAEINLSETAFIGRLHNNDTFTTCKYNNIRLNRRIRALSVAVYPYNPSACYIYIYI